MYVIFKIHQKQYKVKKNQIIHVDSINKETGNLIIFKKVILSFNKKKFNFGTPFLSIKVIGKIIAHKKLKKIQILKFKRRKHYKKKIGHRQKITILKIQDFKF